MRGAARATNAEIAIATSCAISAGAAIASAASKTVFASAAHHAREIVAGHASGAATTRSHSRANDPVENIATANAIEKSRPTGPAPEPNTDSRLTAWDAIAASTAPPAPTAADATAAALAPKSAPTTALRSTAPINAGPSPPIAVTCANTAGIIAIASTARTTRGTAIDPASGAAAANADARANAATARARSGESGTQTRATSGSDAMTFVISDSNSENAAGPKTVAAMAIATSFGANATF